MSKKLLIYVLCHCGLGSGLLMKMAVDSLLKEKGVAGEVIVYGVTDMPSFPTPDIVFASQSICDSLRKNRSDAKDIRMISTMEYFNKDKLKALVFPVIDEVLKK